MKLIKKELKIKEEEVLKIQKLLDTTTPSTLSPQNDIYQVFTIDFGDDIETDIKVCLADDKTFFIDPVLFDTGREVCLLDVRYDLIGEYSFLYNDTEYIACLSVDK